MTNRQLFISTPSVNQPILRGWIILLLGFCILQVRAQNPTLTTTNITICGGSVDLNSLITTNGTSIRWSEKPQATAISAGSSHSLALLSDGTVTGWGFNEFGQTTSPSFAATPTAIAAGGLHSLALLSNGTVVGWGDNFYGQSSSRTFTTTPIAIAAGGQHSLALLSSGYMAGWGRNDYGQVSGGAFAPLSIAIAAGDLHSLALFSTGIVVGWGLDFFPRNTPSFAATPTAIAANDAHNFALLSNGTVVEWDNLTGQKTIHSFAASPTAIAANGGHSLALLSNGTVVGWGNNSSGQTTIPSFAATPTAISAGGGHSLALLSNGSVVGWGNNFQGQANSYDALPLSNSVITPTSTKTYYVVVRNANGGKSTGSVTVTFGGVNLSPTTTNNALNFDGTNDAVEITNCNNNPLTNTDALTIEYWFKGISNHSAVRLQPDNNSFISSGYISGLTGLHLVRINNVPYSVATGNATDGNWHHVAMTWQRNTTNGFKSYLDGVLVAQTNTPNAALPVVTSGMWLGSRSGIAEFMSGSIDEVRVWGVARTQAEIQANRLGCTSLAGASGLVLYYQFNHGAADGDNSGGTSLSNSANASTFPAILRNFTRTGSTSNWVASPLCTDAYTWTGAVSNDWANLSNWSPTIVPTNTSSLTIPPTTNGLVLTGNQTANIVTLSGNGKIILGNYNLTTNNLNGGSPTAYVVTNGTGSLTLKNIGTTTTLFPVGPSETIYAPVTITNNVNRDFTVKVGTTITNGVALPNSVGLQWEVTPSVLTGNSATLALGWSSGSQLAGFNPNSSVQIAHYNGTTWDAFRAATVSGTNPYTATVMGITAFSPFIVTNQTVLPVELWDFKGQNTEGGNLLTWTTANEVNNKGFNVERAPQPPKGAFAAWDVLGFVASKSPKGTLNDYEFTDKAPLWGGGGLYRLRQMDNDGKETLSKVISVANVDTHGRVYVRVYPSVTTGILTIETGLSGDFQIINLLGQQVLSGKTPPLGVGGLDVSALPQGAYVLRVGTEQVKFVKQ